MKKLVSVLAVFAVMALAGCGGCCGDKKPKAHKSKSSSHKVMKKSSTHKKSHGARSELDKIWCDVCNMWTGKGHKH